MKEQGQKEELVQLLELLDDKSRVLVWHLWWHRHASISELRHMIDAATDFEVLYRLEETINGKAQEVWRRPAVCFRELAVDPASGSKILFNWWFLDGGHSLLSEGKEPLVDVFPETDSVIVIAQVPSSIDTSRHQLWFKNGILKIRVRKKDTAGEQAEDPGADS